MTEERSGNPYELLRLTIKEMKLFPLTDEQIQQIYECESEHFEVPVPNFRIQPRREDGTLAAYLDGIPAIIEFFGRPTIDVVYHELVHHALYFHCERVIGPPQPLIIEGAIAEESDLKCPKCDSDSVEKEKNAACLYWQCVCLVCGHSWIEEFKADESDKRK